MTTLTRVLTTVSLVTLLSAAGAAQAQKPQTGSTPVATTGRGETAATPRDTSVSADYRLVAGDKLRIEVYKDPQLSQSLQIRPDGKITLPLVGDLAAAGRTALELRDAIVGSLKEYNSSPALKDSVTVIVTETMPQTVSVIGEVNSPGPQPIHGQTSVLQVLAAAGGFTDWAKTKDIKIQRKTAAGITMLRFNYKDAVEGRSKPMYVQPGDIIIVP